jgi:hypothetical protein
MSRICSCLRRHFVCLSSAVGRSGRRNANHLSDQDTSTIGVERLKPSHRPALNSPSLWPIPVAHRDRSTRMATTRCIDESVLTATSNREPADDASSLPAVRPRFDRKFVI